MGGKNSKSFSPNKESYKNKAEENTGIKCGQPENLDYVEGVVCNSDEINENEMKVLPLGEDGGKILLIKQGGELHAIGTKCSHYGAPLNTGALGQGRLRCPWHGACFNIKNGDIEDHPGLDSIPCHKVSVGADGAVKVRAKRRDLETNKRTKEMSTFNSENGKTVVIVGGGPSGATCAQTLRQEGFTGRIVMVCKESALPYDRPKLSKAMDVAIDNILLRSQLFYNEHNIETLLGKEAIGLNTNEKTVKLNTNENLRYDDLYIATGSKPKLPDLPGVELSNIFLLRTYIDSAAIAAQLSPEKHVVILGFGFIGMEAAAYCVGKCASVTVVGRSSVPFKELFGEEIGERIKREFVGKGVNFAVNNGIARFMANEDGKTLEQVELLDGTYLQCDVAVLGIGSTFNTEWLKETQVQLLENDKEKESSDETAGKSRKNLKSSKRMKIKKEPKDENTKEHEITTEKTEIEMAREIPKEDVAMKKVNLRADNTVDVNKFLKTNVDNVYAGGDIAYAPVHSSGDAPAAIGHFGLAHYHGKVAALNICGKETPLRAVPFFWTMLFGRSYRYAGHGRSTGVKILGSLEDFKFFAYYFKNGKVIAMSSVGRDPIVAEFANRLYEGRHLTQEEVERDPLGWIANKPADLVQAASAPNTTS